VQQSLCCQIVASNTASDCQRRFSQHRPVIVGISKTFQTHGCGTAFLEGNSRVDVLRRQIQSASFILRFYLFTFVDCYKVLEQWLARGFAAPRGPW
jgi:hypothetical protein